LQYTYLLEDAGGADLTGIPDERQKFYCGCLIRGVDIVPLFFLY